MNKRTLFCIKRGELNNSEVINNIIKYNPKLIIINATSIIKKKLIKIFYKKIINIHAGLLPYYKVLDVMYGHFSIINWNILALQYIL